MYKKIILAILLLTVKNNSFSQNKLLHSLSIGINQSIGKDRFKSFNTGAGYSGIYLSRRQYQNPCLTLLADASLLINKQFTIGLRSGAYMHFQEYYTSSKKQTTVWIPLLVCGNIIFGKVKERPIGLDLSGGVLFFRIDDRVEVYTDAKIFNASVFYNLSKKSIVRVGIEKQIDNVTMSYINLLYNTPSTFNYHLNRLALCISYGLRINKS